MYIFVSGGKTMGHISPLLGIILKLKEKYDFVYFGLEGSMEEDICKKYNITFHKMNLTPFYRKNIFRNFLTFYLIFKEKKIIKNTYKKHDVKMIISSGGFVSIPLILGINNCKKLLLESNSTLGLANRFLASFVDYVGVQFDSIEHTKKVLVGNPIKIFEPNFDHPYFYNNSPIILFVGGSNGAFDIVKIANDFNIKYPNVKLFVITGERYFDTFVFNSNVKVFKKIPELSSILKKFSVVVSRAGAATITELLLANVPFILIPSKNVTGNHQILNAKYLYDKGVCEVINDIVDDNSLKLIYDLLLDDVKKNDFLIKQKALRIIDPLDRISKLIEKEINYQK